MAWPPSAMLEGGARDEVVGGMKSELVPTNLSKLTLPPLSSYIRKKGDDLISHPLLSLLNDWITRMVKKVISTSEVHDYAEDKEQGYRSCQEGTGFHLKKDVDEAVQTSYRTCES